MRAPSIVTGGAGFIGSNLVRRLLSRPDGGNVVVYDNLSYAGSMENLAGLEADQRFRFVRGDVCDRAAVNALLREHGPGVIYHLAAATHVDRSIDDPAEFVRTNVTGTFEMLLASLTYRDALPSPHAHGFRFVHVSTDEVFGSLGPNGRFHEDSPHAPSSPYAASKAGADDMAHAFARTYGLHVVVTNCSNNYGPFQFPEKLIPLVTLNALEGKPLPVYGDGANVRDWIHVEDHCAALMHAAEYGATGAAYCVGGDNEHTTLSMVNAICDALDDIAPRPDGSSFRGLITFVTDRPAHDKRYAVDSSRIRALGWSPSIPFAEGLRATVEWYVKNRAARANVHGRQRLGLGQREREGR